jgi:hypothetical protein
MSTRSITRIFSIDESNEKTHLVSFYRHSDGYPEGHGKDLAKILSKGKYVSGLPIDEDSRVLGNYFNGAGCASASIVSLLKDEPGRIYIIPAERDNMWEEWVYIINLKDKGGEITIQIKDTREGEDLWFEGTPQELMSKFGK